MSKVELSTKEIELSRFFLKGARKPELLVLVEDEKDDVPFWQKMFECVSDKYLRIHVHSIRTAPKQYRTNLTKQEQIEQIQVWQKRVCKGKTPIELIHDSVYNCDALDMKDCGIVAIQQQILANCP